VLVVDDDSDIRDALCIVLEHNGYRALPASNGEEALARLRADAPIDLILLDMMMPVMDGWGFRRSQPDGPAFVQIPVVVLTGDGRASSKAAAIGAAGYLKKPLDLGDLLEVVGRHCPPDSDGSLPGRREPAKS
jgi:CheY-like chemotaxis protein